jgi:hypothetical protein
MATDVLPMCFSQQQPSDLAPISLQLPAASIEAWNNCGTLQYMPLFSDKKNPSFVQSNTNVVLPEETLSSYTDNPYQNPTIPITLSHEEMPYTQLGTKAMCSSTNTSDMPIHTALSFISSTSNTSSNDNTRSVWEPMRPLSNKPCKEKQSSEDSDVSGTISRNGSAGGGRSKETLVAFGTVASEEFRKFSRLSLKTKCKNKCAVCMLLCEHFNEICGSNNGGRFFD